MPSKIRKISLAYQENFKHTLPRLDFFDLIQKTHNKWLSIMNEPIYYVPPKNHDNHIKRMITWLIIFFATLLVAATLIIIFADTLARKLPFSVEKQFVKPYETMADYFLDEEPSEHKTKVRNYLNELSSKLIAHMNIPKDHTIDVHYIDNSTVNAFATLGGHVFIFRGLVDAMPDENSLSMVLAHEIAHIKHRDPLAGMGRGFALQMIYGFAVGDYSMGTEIILDGGQIGLMYFGREQEQSADLLAIEAIHKHYGHADGYDSLFTYIINETDERETEQGLEDENQQASIDWQKWLSTHPKLERRIELLKQHAYENDFSTSGNKKPIPQAIRNSIRAIKKENEQKKRKNAERNE